MATPVVTKRKRKKRRYQIRQRRRRDREAMVKEVEFYPLEAPAKYPPVCNKRQAQFRLLGPEFVFDDL